jgi:hypothetical protein
MPNILYRVYIFLGLRTSPLQISIETVRLSSRHADRPKVYLFEYVFDKPVSNPTRRHTTNNTEAQTDTPTNPKMDSKPLSDTP